MCTITIYGTSLCVCGFGFKTSAWSHEDCRSPKCATSETHPRTCRDHRRCIRPGEKWVMDVRRAVPCLECEQGLRAAGDLRLPVEVIEPLDKGAAQPQGGAGGQSGSGGES